MRVGASLAMKVGNWLVRYADASNVSTDGSGGADDPLRLHNEGPSLPPLDASAPGQLLIFGALAEASDDGLPVSAISVQTGITKDNVSEKLKKLASRGYVETLSDTWPPRWRLTAAARRTV